MWVYISRNDHRIARYFKDFNLKNFKIVEGMYNVGDLYENEEIKKIEGISPDTENDSEVFNYDLFKIYTTQDGEYYPDYLIYYTYYLAVKREVKMSKPIIDVSKFNGRIEWPEVKPHIQRAIIRLGYRGWGMQGALVVDDRFHYNAWSCIYENIPWDVYYFPQEISESEVVDAVDFIGETLSEYPEPGTIWIDSEYANRGAGRGDKISVHKRSVLLGMMRSFLNNSSRHYRVGLYCSDAWYKDNINNDIAGFKNLWIARYSDKPPKNTDEWEIWQYTSKGELPGIKGKVDLSILRGDFKHNGLK